MGQRGSKAAFMPNKFVFPGGAVDADDSAIPLAKPLVQTCHARLLEDNSGPSPETLAVAAIRELWEETGLILGAPEEWQDAPKDWSGFAKAGFRPSAEKMYFFFRAITPPGPPRRFDARFFLVDADQLAGDLDDVPCEKDPVFNIDVPLSCPGVPPEVLRPRQTWANPADYDAQAAKLAAMMAERAMAMTAATAMATATAAATARLQPPCGPRG